jgi:phosphatidylglycerol---prolipoprotein diacylglyceryl transferase
MPPEARIDAEALARLARDRSVPAGLRAARTPAEPLEQSESPQSAASSEMSGQDEPLPGWIAKATEELLTVTCWLDPGAGERGAAAFGAAIMFSGERTGVTGTPGPGDTFWRQETFEGIEPGSGPVALTAEIRGITPGEWTVSARPAKRSGAPLTAAGRGRAPWPRRIAVPGSAATRMRTRSLLLTRVPGVIRFAYPVLVCTGALTGLGLVAWLLSRAGYPVLTPVLLSLAAIAAGVAGGKTWYIAVHRGRKRDGWCIQGFVAGACAVVGAAALAGPGVPPGVYLAAAAPALLTGMAIGRLGCFWAGCCTGKPVAARVTAAVAVGALIASMVLLAL